MKWLHVWSSKAEQVWNVTITIPGKRFYLDWGEGEESYAASQVVGFTRDSGKHESIDFRMEDPSALVGLDISDNLLYGCVPEFTEFSSLESFVARNNHFTTYSPCTALPPSLVYIDLSGNNLTQRALDQMLLDLSAGLVERPSTGFVRIDGPHMASPSADGTKALEAIEEKGWSSFTNESAGWEWDVISPAGEKSVRIGVAEGSKVWVDWAGAMDSLKGTGVPVTFTRTLASGGLIRILVDEEKNLESLNLAGQGFSGEIIPLAGLSLKTLDLSGNSFSGTLGSLPGALTYLDLHDNEISGYTSGPVPLGLVHLDLRMNSLGQTDIDAILRDFAESLPREEVGVLRLRKNEAPSVQGEEWAEELRDAGWTVEHDGDNVYSLALANAQADLPGGMPFRADDPTTVSLWVKYISVGYQVNADLLYNEQKFGMKIASNVMLFEFGYLHTVYSSIKSGVATNDGKWHHVVMTYDGSGNVAGAKMWVDGVDVTVINKSGTVPDTALGGEFWVNTKANAAAGLRMDEATIWAHEFSQSEIVELYNNGAPKNAQAHSRSSLLRAWWKMGDGDSYPTIRDHSPTRDGSFLYPNVMEEASMTLLEPVFSTHKSLVKMKGVGGDLMTMFYGVSDYNSTTNMSFGNILNFDRSDSFSISFWVFPLSSGPILHKVTDGYTNGYMIERNGESFMFYLTGTGMLSVKTSETFPTRQWTMLTVSYNGSGNASGATLYINGSEATRTVVQDNLTGGTVASNNLRIGAVHYLYKSSHKVCHVSFHSKALTSQEVADMYNNGTPTDLRKLSTASHLMAYFFAFSQLQHNLTMTSGLSQASFVEDTP